MSLRTRLTILYTAVLAGILLLFGVAVSLFFNLRVNRNLDSELTEVAWLVMPHIKVDPDGQLVVYSLNFQEQLPPDVFVQVFDRSGKPTYSRPALMRTLDPDRLRLLLPQIHSINNGSQSLRVLTVPFQTSSRPIGVIQVGVSSDLANELQQTLLQLTIGGVIAGIVVAAVAVSLSTRQALAALESATQVATSSPIPLAVAPRTEPEAPIWKFETTVPSRPGRASSCFS